MIEPRPATQEELRHGDIVRLTKPGDASITAPVVLSPIYKTKWITVLGKTFYVDEFADRGYSLELVSTEHPRVPTEPGIYQSDKGDLWVLDSDSERPWRRISSRDGGVFIGVRVSSKYMDSEAPFELID